MEEELIQQQPGDRRLAASNVNAPSGVEREDTFDTTKTMKPSAEKDVSGSRGGRRRTPSPPTSRRKSTSRSPVRGGGGRDRYRGRGSPSPRRTRYRDYSPDRRRRRTPDRRRSRSPPPMRRRDPRFRSGPGGRRRSISRSRTRSMSPVRRSRWSPKRKPNSPQGNTGAPQVQPVSQPGPPPQYGVMPPHVYGGEPYGPATAYNQYGVPPPYGAPYNAAFPPPNAWGVNDAYAQQGWMQPPPVADPSQQMTQMQAVPPTVAPPTVLVPNQMPPSMVVPQTAANLNVLPDVAPGTMDPNPSHDAVAQEAENQRDELKKQRTSYLKKTSVLKKELRMLKEQRKDFNTGSAPPSPTTKGFIDENEKLQNQILKKISTIENVIDMLTGIIGEENLEKDADMDISDGDVPESGGAANKQGKYEISEHVVAETTEDNSRNMKRKKHSNSSAGSTDSSSTSSSSSQSSSSSENEDDADDDGKRGRTGEDDVDDDDDTSSERLKHKAMESMKSKQIHKKLDAKDEKRYVNTDERKRFNYVFYDPEMHWCQTCDIFPKTAKDYLNHLHTKDHINRESMETPWHTDMVNDQYPSFENAPTKRTPIRGLTFFVPATAWFCKLCNIWMGDLHCASTHLKSQTHSNKYNAFLEKNPHFEVNWLADRQRVLNEKKTIPLPPQITSVSTTAAERSSGKKSKRDDEKSATAKKRKKRGTEKKAKKQKKKKQRSKKRKKNASGTSSSSSSSSESSSSDGEQENDVHAKSAAKKQKSPIVVPELNNPDPAASIRVAMRKREQELDLEAPAPPPPIITEPAAAVVATSLSVDSTPIGKWTTTQVGGMPVREAAVEPATTVKATDDESKRDDAIIQQWNVVQPVISESEKKLLEQLKGKLKNKPREEAQHSVAAAVEQSANSSGTATTTATKHVSSGGRRGGDNDRRRRSRSPAYGGGRGGASRRSRSRQRSRSRGRSRTRSRSRGGWGTARRGGRRSRSRSRGRRSRSFDRRRRVSRSRSRSARRRSRSYDRRRGRVSRSRTRSTSPVASKNRIEKPVIKHSEFRPRVPERDREKDNRKTTDGSKDKREGAAGAASKKSKSSSSSNNNALAGGKKLPFIGKMPVFKKQTTTAGTTGQPENGEKRSDISTDPSVDIVVTAGVAPLSVQQQRVAAPTAAQIQMAMMEDVYGNAPPFHPDAGMGMNMMMDYDDLMPDPVQFVNIMGQAPPPPPPPNAKSNTSDRSDDEAGDDGTMLPPGIDETESEEFVSKPISDASKGTLPKDLEEALNIIFPGERNSDETGDSPGSEEERKLKVVNAGETQIIMDEPIMQVEELAKEGIHMVTLEETSLAAMDDASQLSMNEPLVFSKPSSHAQMSTAITITTAMDTATNIIDSTNMIMEDASSQNAADVDLNIMAVQPVDVDVSNEQQTNGLIVGADIEVAMPPSPTDIPMPETVKADMVPVDAAALVYDLDDIPQPPDSPTDSEKQRRQEELDDLAMLGIDADDMAAQCM